MSYKSPITIVSQSVSVLEDMNNLIKDCADDMDDAVLTEVYMTITHKYGIDIDKDELIKALKYDRNQYELGYMDGLVTRWIPINQKLPEKSGKYLVCGKNTTWICEFLDLGSVKGWSNSAENPIVEAWMPLPLPLIGEEE